MGQLLAVGVAKQASEKLVKSFDQKVAHKIFVYSPVGKQYCKLLEDAFAEIEKDPSIKLKTKPVDLTCNSILDWIWELNDEDKETLKKIPINAEIEKILNELGINLLDNYCKDEKHKPSCIIIKLISYSYQKKLENPQPQVVGSSEGFQSAILGGAAVISNMNLINVLLIVIIIILLFIIVQINDFQNFNFPNLCLFNSKLPKYTLIENN